MKFTLFIAFLLQIPLFASVLLVPQDSIPFSNYYDQCHKQGYECTQNYFKNKVLNSPSEKFENFINSIDFSNEDFRNRSLFKIKSILSSENIDLDEARLLTSIIDKLLQNNRNSNLLLIKKEITETIDYLENSDQEISDQNNYIIFKKAITKKQYFELKYKLKYIQATLITPYFEPQNLLIDFQKKEPLLSGECERPVYSKLIDSNTNEQTHVLPLFNNDCAVSLTSAVLDKTGQFIKENKKPLIYTLISVGLIALFNNYQLEIK